MYKQFLRIKQNHTELNDFFFLRFNVKVLQKDWKKTFRGYNGLAYILNNFKVNICPLKHPFSTRVIDLVSGFNDLRSFSGNWCNSMFITQCFSKMDLTGTRVLSTGIVEEKANYLFNLFR